MRRLQQTRELNDVLVLEVLEACSATPFADVPRKYDLTQHCDQGAWEQAALWVFARTLPSWNLTLELPVKGAATARVSSQHAPPFTIERRHASPANALLEAIVAAHAALARLGLARA